MELINVEKDVNDDYRAVFVVNSLVLGDGSIVPRAVCRPSEIRVETVSGKTPYRLVHYRMIYWDHQPESLEEMADHRVYFAPLERWESMRKMVSSVETKSLLCFRVLRHNYSVEELESLVIEDFLLNVVGRMNERRAAAPTTKSLRAAASMYVRYGDVEITDPFHTLLLSSPNGQSLEVELDVLTYRASRRNPDGTRTHYPEDPGSYLEAPVSLLMGSNIYDECMEHFKVTHPL